MNLNILSEKIQTLSPEQVRKVEDFVEFLHLRGQDRAFSRTASAASSPAFAAVWNNPGDDAYNAIPV